MPDPLLGYRAKLDRAREHLEALKVETGRESVNVELVAEYHKDRGELILKVTRVPEFPARWGAIIGDALHNWRSALDHLAFELVKLDWHSYWKHSQFPIADDLKSLDGNWRFRGTLERLSPEHRALVESFQPGFRGHPKHDPLAWLRSLSDLDKHRVIIGTFVAPDNPRTLKTFPLKGWTMGKWHYMLVGVPLEVGAELLRIEGTPIAPDAKMGVQYDLSVYIALPGGARLDKTLLGIKSRVEEVTEAFASWFR